MILFEANAVAPLVKLPDAAVEERVQREREEKSPTLAKTSRMGHPTSIWGGRGIGYTMRELFS